MKKTSKVVSGRYAQWARMGMVLALGAALSACAGKKVQESIQVGEAGGNVTEDGMTQGLTDESLSGSGLSGPQGSFDGDPLGKRVIYFEYDSAALTADGNAIAQAHGQYLADHPEFRLTLEGHADERGTSEYNLALGEDRAKTVSQIMAAFGVASDRLNLVSYGEERPVELGHDETSYSLNRRVELIYQ